MRHLVSIVLVMLLVAIAAPNGAVGHAAEPVLLEKPTGATDAKDKAGRPIGWQVGLSTNALIMTPPDMAQVQGIDGRCPLTFNRAGKPRNVTSVEQWKSARDEIRQAVLGYLGPLPPADLPLDAKIESESDQGDIVLRQVSLAFSKERRGQFCLVIPKGLPASAPALIMYDSWGGGAKALTEGVYSRSYATHMARHGFVVAAMPHWYEEYGKSADLCTLGAAVHMGRRTVDYLRQQKDLVAPDQIAVFGHTYGGELAVFLAALDERIAACGNSHSQNAIEPTEYHVPPWSGRSGGLGCVARVEPAMFTSARPVDIDNLPFVTQEFMALIAPRPYLSVMNNAVVSECIRPVWKLYGRERAIELVQHKWKENLPVNARDYLADFLLRQLRGQRPGQVDEGTTKGILGDLRGGDAGKRLTAIRLAAWWRCSAAKDELAKLLASRDADAAARRAAAKALERIGAMDALLPLLKDADPIVRLTVVEAMQTCGTPEAFEELDANMGDKDKWVREAKEQTIQVRVTE